MASALGNRLILLGVLTEVFILLGINYLPPL